MSVPNDFFLISIGRKNTGYSRVPVTAGSICEVTVITSYGNTQDDEHLCGNVKSWSREGQNGTERSYGIRWRSEMRVTDETKVTDGRTYGRTECIAQV